METAQLLPSFLDDSGIDSIEPTPLAQKAKASLALTRTQPRPGPQPAAPDSPEVDRFLLRIRNAEPVASPTHVTTGTTSLIDPPSYATGSLASTSITKLPGMSLPDHVGTGERVPGSATLDGPKQLAPATTAPAQMTHSGSMLMPLLVLFIIVASVVLMLELAGLWP